MDPFEDTRSFELQLLTWFQIKHALWLIHNIAPFVKILGSLTSCLTSLVLVVVILV